MLAKIGNVNAAASFIRIIASNLATGNDDMSAVIGSKSAAAMVTLAIDAAIPGVFIVSDVATRNGHTTARNQDAATETNRLAVRSVARDDSTRKLQGGSSVSIDAAARSCLVSRDHSACHFEAGFRTRYAQATAPATAIAVGDVTALDFDRTLRKNHMTVVTQVGSRGNHAALEIEYAARFNVDHILYGTAFRCYINSAKARNDMLVRSLGGAKSICIGRALSLIVSKTLRSDVIRAASLFPLHTRKLTRRRLGRIDRS